MAEQLVDLRHPAMESFNESSSTSNRPARTTRTGSLDQATTSKSRRTLRQTKSVIEAYPLPNPSQFENAADDILYPMQSLKKDREKSNDPPLQAPALSNTDKQPFPGVASKCEIETVSEEDHVQKEMARKVVVVYNGEKKFATAPVDIALSGYARAEGDAIAVVVFLEHIMSPMGMKMVADLKQFSGVNQSILKQAVLGKTTEVETMLRDTARLELCQRNKIQLDVKVLPGPNPKALLAKEVIDSHATCVIFDKNAMKHRKYYEEHLACQILRLRSDGRSVETVSLFVQGMIGNPSRSSITSSGSSSDSSMNLDHLTGSASGSIWSKLKMFGSKRSSSHGGSVVGGSSRTSSNVGSPRLPPQDEALVIAESEVLEESFSFDSPKPNPAAEAYAYAAAAGLERFGTYSRGSIKRPTALAA